MAFVRERNTLILCRTCLGSGRVAKAVWVESNGAEHQVSDFEVCPFCKGSGRVWEITRYEAYAPTKVET